MLSYYYCYCLLADSTKLLGLGGTPSNISCCKIDVCGRRPKQSKSDVEKPSVLTSSVFLLYIHSKTPPRWTAATTMEELPQAMQAPFSTHPGTTYPVRVSLSYIENMFVASTRTYVNLISKDNVWGLSHMESCSGLPVLGCTSWCTHARLSRKYVV